MGSILWMEIGRMDGWVGEIGWMDGLSGGIDWVDLVDVSIE